LRVDQRPYFIDEPAGCIDIGWVLVPTDKKQVFSVGKTIAASWHMVNIRKHVHEFTGSIFGQHCFLNRTHNQRRICGLYDRQLRATGLFGRACQYVAVLKLSQALFA